MANSREVLGIQLDISGLSPSAFQPLNTALEATALRFRTTMGKAIHTTATQLEDNIQEALGKAIGHGVKDIDKLQRAFYDAASPLLEAQAKALDLEDQLAKAVDNHTRVDLKNKIMGLKVVSDEYKKLHAAQLKAETAVFDRRVKLADEFNEYFAQSFEDKFEQGAEGLGETLNHLVTLNLKDAFKKGGKFFSMMGAGAAAKNVAGGGGGGIGKALEMVGKGMAVIGGMAAGIAGLVKVLLDADAQAKEFNRDIVKASGGMDLLGTAGVDVSGSLDEIRKAAVKSTAAFNPLNKELQSSVREVVNLGLTTKEYLEVTQKFAEVGVTWNQMRDGAKNLTEATDNYTKYVKTATAYSRVFGEDLGTMTEKMGEHMKDLGRDLEDVSAGFAIISKEAMNSGNGTKRFYNMLLQATSGVTMYNLRLGGTAKLFGQLTRILGLKSGGQMLQSLTGAISGESYQDRYKRILTTGKGTTQKVLASEAGYQATDIQKSMRGFKGSTDTMTPGAKATALKMANASNQDLIKMMAKLDDKDRASLLAGIRHSDADLARRMEGFIDVSKGASGKMEDMVKGIEHLSAGGKMIMELERMQQVIGKPLDQMNMMERMAYQQQTGMSSEQIEQLRRVASAVTGDFENAKRAAEIANQTPGKLGELNKNMEKSGMMLKLDEKTGKHIVVSIADQDKTIKSNHDAMMNWERTSGKEEHDAMSKADEISQEIAQNTYDLTNIVSQSMIGILEEIGSYVNKILVFLGLKDSNKDLKDAILDMNKKTDEKQESLDKEIQGARDKVKFLQDQKGGSGSEQDARRKAILEGQSLIKSKSKERSELGSKRRRGAALAAGGAESQIELFKKLKERGVSNEEALSTSGGLTEAQAKEALSKIEKKGDEGRQAGANVNIESFGGDTAAELTASRNAAGTVGQTDAEKLAVKEFVESQKNTKDTGDIKVDTKKSLTVLEKQYELSKDSAEKADRKNIVDVLKEHGFDVGALQAQLGDKAAFNKELPNVAGQDKSKYESLRIEPVADVAILANNTVYKGGKGDAAFLVDQGAAAGKRGAGGGANVSIVINATAGREAQVRKQVYDGLKDYYGVMTGAR